ncbi:hypothetical protein SLS55_007443 [Diplodia seriata]|uniref:Uncharacterized protein n=1 Tax=Diplodia seriata TaxID=420778 RepID=A0ABR3CDI6_9PEZI
MTPIQQLQRTDADVYLLFLSTNGILFQNETNDPWYSAHDVAGYAAYVAIDPTGQDRKKVYAPIPDYQWQLDVEKLNNISLAWLQQYFVDIATGPSDPRMDPFSILPRNENDKRTCRNQKILSSDYTNFSIFGLATTLVAGGLIIIVSYVLEPLVIWIQRRRNLDVYARVEWSMNQTLQLQRMAHEELGLGEWECCDADVPRTRRRERLAVLDLDDMKHPKLKAPPPVFDELLAGPVEKESARQNGREKGEEQKEPRAEEAVAVASEGSGDEEITQDGTAEGTEVNLPRGII